MDPFSPNKRGGIKPPLNIIYADTNGGIQRKPNIPLASSAAARKKTVISRTCVAIATIDLGMLNSLKKVRNPLFLSTENAPTTGCLY
jgi:hypothetical protein